MNSMLSNSTLRREARCITSSSGRRSIDSTLNGGITLARSGTCDLASTAPGDTAFEKRPPSSCSSASQEAPQKPSASWPVSRFVPPGQSATGPPDRVDAADRLVGQPALASQRLHGLGPARALSCSLTRAPARSESSAGSQRLPEQLGEVVLAAAPAG